MNVQRNPRCAHCDERRTGRRETCPACGLLVCPPCRKASTPTDCNSYLDAGADGGPPDD